MVDDGDRARLEAVSDVWRTAPSLEEAMAVAEAAVVRWSWFTYGDCVSPEPYSSQRRGVAPGRALRGEPDVIAFVDRVGFDEHDRAVVSSRFEHEARLGGQDIRFFEGGTCRQLHFHGRGDLLSVTLFEYEHVLLVRQAAHAQDHDDSPPRRWLWNYSYGDGDRLERAHRRGWDPAYPLETQRLMAAGSIETFEYDDKGRLSRITDCHALGGGDPVVIYRRRTRASSGTRLVTRLVDAIEEVVSRRAVEERVWCMALHYEAESPFPPDVVFGVQREREEWGRDVDLLNPAEWSADGPPRRLKLDDPDLLDLCASGWDALSAHDEAAARAVKLLNSIAKRLNQISLSDHLNVTDDFFVYAVDLELEDLDANLRVALAKVRYRALVKSGLTSP